MTAVKATIDIDAPPEDVWDALMDPTRLREWVTIHRKLGKSPEPPLELGDELDQTLCLRGVNFKVHWTVREADRPRRAVWEGKGPARSKSRTVYEVHAKRRRDPVRLPQRVHRPGRSARFRGKPGSHGWRPAA